MDKKYFIAICLFLLLIAVPGHAGVVHFGYDTYPPFCYRSQGEDKGLILDVLREASKRLGVTPVFHFLPFKRVMDYVRAGELDAAVCVAKNREREDEFIFSKTGFHVDDLILYVYDDGKKQVRSLEDLRGADLLAVRGYAYPMGLINALEINLKYVKTSPILYKMLAAGRYKGALGHTKVGQYYLEVFDKERRVTPSFMVSRMIYYLAFSLHLGQRGQPLADAFALEVEAILEEMDQR